MGLSRLKHIKPKMYSIVPGLFFDALVDARVSAGDIPTYEYWIYDQALQPVHEQARQGHVARDLPIRYYQSRV